MCVVSIIVPFFNVENYIARCVDSLLSQGLRTDDYEIILVNDGSTDDSLSICETFCRQHKNIFVISQTNKGAGAARNTGIRHAHGKYVCFVDADDYLADNGLSQIIQHCSEKVDLIRYWCRIIHPGTKDEQVKADGGVIYKGDGFGYLRKWGLETFCWNYLYRKDFILKNKLAFEDVVMEDFYFMADVLFCNPTIISLAARIYNYEIHETSRSTTMTVEHSRRWTEDSLLTLSHVCQKVSPYKDIDKELYEACMTSMEGTMITFFSRLLSADYSLKEYKKILKQCKSIGVLPLRSLKGGKKIVLMKRIIRLSCRFPVLYVLGKKLYNSQIARKLKQNIDRNH